MIEWTNLGGHMFLCKIRSLTWVKPHRGLSHHIHVTSDHTRGPESNHRSTHRRHNRDGANWRWSGGHCRGNRDRHSHSGQRWPRWESRHRSTHCRRRCHCSVRSRSTLFLRTQQNKPSKISIFNSTN